MNITPWHEIRRNSNRSLRRSLSDFFFYRAYYKRSLPFKPMTVFRHFLHDLFGFIFPEFCREIKRKELTGVVDRLGGDGVCLYLNGASIEECEKEIMGMLRMHEERAAQEAYQDAKKVLTDVRTHIVEVSEEYRLP